MPSRGDRGRAKRWTCLATLAALLLSPGLGRAQEPDARTPQLRFDGFGTFGVVHSTEERADFVATPFRPDGAGFTSELSLEVDSRIAGQLTFDATPRLTAVLQVVVEQGHDDRFQPSVEWANVRYAITPELAVRAGRSPLGAFLLSDFRKVSYAQPWVRPPVELYGLVPVFASDGIDATYRTHLGDWTSTTQIGYGRAEAKYGDGESENEATSHGLGISTTLERIDFTARLAYTRGHLTVGGLEEFFDAYRSLGPQGSAVADRYDADDKPMTFAGLGVLYDPGSWFATGELGRIESSSFIGRSTAWYVSGGFRVGPFTPYATYSGVDVTSEMSSPGVDPAGLPPQLAEVAGGLNSVLNLLLGWKAVQQTLSVGARWDLMPNVALKLQIDRVDLADRSPGMLVNWQPGFERGGATHVLSASTAFVF